MVDGLEVVGFWGYKVGKRRQKGRGESHDEEKTARVNLWNNKDTWKPEQLFLEFWAWGPEVLDFEVF